VAITITSGTNVVRTLAGAANRGTNRVIWDGNDSTNAQVPTGNYAINITPSAMGYTNWTQISLDTNPGNYVFAPRGVAVDNNLSSLYFGRVFVGNALPGPDPRTVPGDTNTILLLNADGSFSDNGPDGNGGYDMAYDGDPFGDVPQKLRLADDDRLYMVDLSIAQVASFDPALGTSRVVFDENNFVENPYAPAISAGVGWFSMDISGAATTNALLWLGEWDALGAGVWYWALTNGIADPSDNMGTQAIEVTNQLSVAASGGLMVDSNLDVFVGQDITQAGDSTNFPCMEFTNLTPAEISTNLMTQTAWTATNTDNNFLGVYDVTIDSRQNPKYVACAMNNGPGANGIRLLYATNGAVVVTNLDPANQYFATAWDSVGNLYGVTGTAHRLRVFSPPSGTNQSVTTALIRIEPYIETIQLSGDNLTLIFLTSASDTASDFSLKSAGVNAVQGPYTPVPGTVVTQISPGLFRLSATISIGAGQFFLIGRATGD
jgi:hypothetical protein